MLDGTPWNIVERLTGMTKSWRARLTGTLSALAMTAGLLTATTTPASADAMACNYDGVTFNACLTIDYAGSGRWNVRVGFDRYLPRAYADAILACPGRGSFSAALWGNDGGHPKDTKIGNLYLTAGWPRSGSNPDGLFAQFYGNGMNLNEDSDGTDEIYAEVKYTDCYNGYTFTYRTGQHTYTF